MDYKVNVLMMAYNHEEFIGQAIESVLGQKTNFPFRLIIGEDLSPDGTGQICKEYAAKYPSQILLVQRDKNVGPYVNFVEIYQTCTAPYIAMCEGDDYWTDSGKLQKQIDFLDNNPAYGICFHKSIERNEQDEEFITNEGLKDTLDIEDLVKQGWFMRTASYVYRNGLFDEFPNWFFKVKATDYVLHILLAKGGAKIKFLDEVMSVYRIHQGGISANMHSNKYKSLTERIELKQFIDKHLDYKYHEHIKSQIYKYRENLFYFLRSKENNTLAEKWQIIQLTFQLDKLNLRNAFKHFLGK